MRAEKASLHIDYEQSQICSVLNSVQVSLKTKQDILALFGLDWSNKMAEGIKSLESILEKHIPEEELKEVNRIIFGKELGWVLLSSTREHAWHTPTVWELK